MTNGPSMPHTDPTDDLPPVSAVPLRLAGIPSGLKTHDRWILWKYTQIQTSQGKLKWTKTPHSAKDGHKIDATNHANGASFGDAVQAMRTPWGRKFTGLGFLLGAGIAGIDVDDCIDEDGNLDERGQRVSDAYRNTYAEISPSGRGFKILVDISSDPKLTVIGKTTPEMEVYGSRRYFTVTGAALPGHATRVAPMAAAFAETAAQLGAKPIADMPTSRGKDSIGIDMKAARDLLDHLPFTFCDLYMEWIRTGMALHHEFDGHPDALELWDEWSQRNHEKYEPGACEKRWGGFGKPGKDEVTMRTFVREAQATGWRAPATIQRAVSDFSPFEDPTPVPGDDDAPTVAKDWWNQYSIGPMLNTEPEPHEWIWRGVLRLGKLLVLAGSGGSSKSYLMLASAVHYSLGNSWGPFELAENHERGRVMVMYNEEDYKDVHERVSYLKHTFMLTAEQNEKISANMAVLPMRGKGVRFARRDEKSGEVEMTDHLTRLEQRIKQYSVKLVILDPMALLHNLEENDNTSIAAFIEGLDAVCMRCDCSMVLVHHFGKTGNMRAREINESNLRGASAIAAHARTVVVMHRLREDEAAEWGVPEQEHARWVMFAVAKNNYGPSGRRWWFNVDERNGTIAPAPAELTYMNARDIRAAVQAARDEDAATEMTQAAEREAAAKAAAEIEQVNIMHALMRDAARRGKLCTLKAMVDIASAAGVITSPKKARLARERVLSEQLTDTDGMISAKGHSWLEDRELLE